jgi:hypothetical protein
VLRPRSSAVAKMNNSRRESRHTNPLAGTGVAGVTTRLRTSRSAHAKG